MSGGDDGLALPEGWGQERLSSLLSALESGKRPRGGVHGIPDGVPSLGGEHLTAEGKFDLTNIKYVPRDFARSMRQGHIRRGDVLIVKDGATTGKTALVDESLPLGEVVANEHLFVCRAMEGIVPGYLAAFLRSPQGQEQIQSHFQGSAQGGINQSFATGTVVPVPPLDEQWRIASRLEKIEQQRMAAATPLRVSGVIVERLRRAALAAAYAGRLTIDWRASREPTDGSAEKLRALRLELARTRGRGYTPPPDDDALPNLPDSWIWARVGEVAQVTIGGTPSRRQAEYWSGDIPWVSSGEVANCRITATRETIAASGLTNSNAKLYPPGTVLIAMIGEGKTRGQAAILDIEACTNQNAAGVIANRDVLDPEFAWRWARAQYETTRAVGRGGNQPALNSQKVRELAIPIPPLDEQQEIVKRTDTMLATADRLAGVVEHAEEALSDTVRAALSKAFRGELVPTEAELAAEEGRSYESGQELLNRLSEKDDPGASQSVAA